MSTNPTLRARLDISKASQAGDLELGETVTIQVTGKVVSLRGPEETLRDDYPDTLHGKPSKDKKKHVYPGTIELEVKSMTVQGTSGFEPLMDEE